MWCKREVMVMRVRVKMQREVGTTRVKRVLKARFRDFGVR